MNKVILLVLENPLQNTPKQNKREIAQLLHVYGVYKKQLFHPVLYLQAASKGKE